MVEQHPSEVKSVYRKAPGLYALITESGRTVEINIKDDDFLYLARMLGFSQWYPNLEEHLEILTEEWLGCILVRGGDAALPGAED